MSNRNADPRFAANQKGLSYSQLMLFKNIVREKVELAFKVDWKRNSDPTKEALRYFKNIMKECVDLISPAHFFKLVDELKRENKIINSTSSEQRG